ncbi:MAG: hypothetical protein KAG56_08205, partial [Sulfurovaceae bacterium]|nr:hypothetical protein [Sulfurovaceae bacterium]
HFATKQTLHYAPFNRALCVCDANAYKQVLEISFPSYKDSKIEENRIKVRDDLKYSSTKAIKSILIKLGIDPDTRDLLGQDEEYTSCKLEELEDYVDLYIKNDTSIFEKRVLGCYFLDCLNEYIVINNQEHSIQNKAFTLLFSDIYIHKEELDYWSDTSDRENEEDWWYITKSILKWKEQKK